MSTILESKPWDIKRFLRDGFVVVDLAHRKPLSRLQAIVKNFFPGDPMNWHTQNAPQEDHVGLVKMVTDAVSQSGLVFDLVQANAKPFLEFLGPDLAVQSVPHVRVSRPSHESDRIGWHRDTFYGNLPWEINIWFPLFPLADGAGLLLLPGSHRIPSVNIRDTEEADAFKKSVTKGSVANQIGYLYAPKSDNTIDSLKLDRTRLIAPRMGQAIVFFGNSVHTSQNRSNQTRISIDLRVRNAHTPTHTKPGYYRTLCRSSIYACIDEFLNAPPGNI